jgi:hypothetical protein
MEHIRTLGHYEKGIEKEDIWNKGTGNIFNKIMG